LDAGAVPAASTIKTEKMLLKLHKHKELSPRTGRGCRGRYRPLRFSSWGENIRKGEAPPPEERSEDAGAVPAASINKKMELI